MVKVYSGGIFAIVVPVGEFLEMLGQVCCFFS